MVPPLNFSCGSKGLLVEGSQGSLQSNIQIAKGINICNDIQKKFSNTFLQKISNIFFISKFFYNSQVKTISSEVITGCLKINQLSPSTENEKILLKREKVIFKKNPLLFLGTRLVSPILINSGILLLQVMTVN